MAVSNSDCDVSEIKEDVVADMFGFGHDSDIGSGDNAGDVFVLASEGCVFVIARDVVFSDGVVSDIVGLVYL